MTSNRLSGRPPTIFDNPHDAKTRFGWICRVLREFSDDPELQVTHSFARKLSGYLQYTLKPETINRMETGSTPFTADRLVAYERALALAPGVLLDVYVYLHRLRAQPGEALLSSIPMSDRAFNDLFYRLITNDPEFSSFHWFSFALALHAGDRRKILASPLICSHLTSRLIDDFAASFERDERLLRETIIHLSSLLAPQIVDGVKAEPIRLFNLVEAFGFVGHESAWRVLLTLAAEIDDGVQAQTLIEPVRRWVGADPKRLNQIRECAPRLLPYCEEILQAPTEAYTAREEALALLMAVKVRISAPVARYLRHSADEIGQLRLQPVGTTNHAISERLQARTQRHLTERRVVGRHGATRNIPGLHRFLHDALFAADRVERLGVSLALGVLPFKAELCRAGGELLMSDLSVQNYGIQRSVIRFMTKLDDPSAHGYFSSFSGTKVIDDGVKLSIAWALGTGTGVDDEQLLRDIASAASPTTRRVVTLAAGRRSYRNLLRDMTGDANGTVRGEARDALKRLQ